jgi:hypothetical protein
MKLGRSVITVDRAGYEIVFAMNECINAEAEKERGKIHNLNTQAD